jgi:hypothetical protein
MELKQFLRTATKRERAEVAEDCQTSMAYLYQLAGEHRHASPQMAIRIERFTRQVAHHSGGRLEAVPRETLVRHP